MSTSIVDEVSPSLLRNEETSPHPRRSRPSSARVSFMHQKLQTAISQAEKTSVDLSQGSGFNQSEDSRAPGDVHVDRSIARYRSAAAVVSFTEPATTFSYSTSFMPGVNFYTFLAAKEAAPARMARRRSINTAADNENQANPKLTARNRNSMLKLNVPDTILYGETGRAVWIYTDKDGYVQRLTEFSDKQVLDKFTEGAPALPDEQHLVVYKEPVTTMAPTTHPNRRNGSVTINSQGNQLRLLNLGEVKALLNGVMAMHKSFALQQFVKCNGSKAFVQRAVYEAGKPAHAWMISNIEPFRDPNAPSSPNPATARPQHSPRPGLTRSNSSTAIGTSDGAGNVIPLVGRRCTSIQTDKACTFVKLTERACAAISELNLRIVRYVEQRLRISLQTFVADFVKDAAGEWWLLQVKAFQVQNKVHPGRVLSLPLKLRMVYLSYRDTVILDEDDDESFEEEDRRRRHRHHRRAILPLSQRNIHKLVQCKCCLAAYPSSELSFKMTLKMISDMLLRIRSRLPPEKTLPFLSAAFARELPESGVAYESWSVCSFCYAIYERDQQLQRVETKFSAALGLPNNKSMAEGLSRIQDRSYVVDPAVSASVIPPQLTLCRLVLVINAIYDIPAELYNAEQDNARIEAAADEIAAAEGRKRPQRAHTSKLYLRINALGYTECIPVNPNDILEASEKAPVGAHRRRNSAASITDDDDTESRDDSEPSEPQSSRRRSSWQRLPRSQTSRNQQSPSNNNNEDVNYWLPTNLIRTIPFFAPHTPLQSKLKETSGITPLLTEDNSVRVQLIRATEPPLQDPMILAARRKPRNRRAALVPLTPNMSDLVMQMGAPTHSVVLGSTKIRMTQFRSSYVTKIDYYACMAITGEMLNIKGNIGLERVRYVDSKLLTSQHRLRAYNGVFIPDESYTTGDALSSEWMDCFRASSAVVTRPYTIISTAIEPVEAINKSIVRAQRNSATNNQGKLRRGIRPTSSRASLMDEDEEMDRELEQMIERANLKQHEAHFQQMRQNPVHSSKNNNEEEMKAVSATAIKQELLRDSAGNHSKSTTQMAMLLNKPVISPRSDLTDYLEPHDNNQNSTSANGESCLLPSPRNRNSMWSLIFLINQAHNLQSRERSCCRWECHYNLLTQRRSALERPPNSSRTPRSGTLAASASADVLLSQSTPTSPQLEVQFNSTHKFWLAGTTLMVQAYLRNNPALRLYFRNDMYASTRSESEGEFYGVLEISKLLQSRGFDTTIDIFPLHDDPTLTPREAAVISRMSPYLSLSVQLSRVSIDPDDAVADKKFVELGYTAEGLQVLRKVP